MDILRLLGVTRGIVALTKTDLVEDEWLELVREDVEEFLSGSPLKEAPVVDVSAVSGSGIDALIKALCELCAQVPARSADGLCRMPVDRVFSMTGFGTVVTGTLWGGFLRWARPSRSGRRASRRGSVRCRYTARSGRKPGRASAWR
jgi:selenocysteine-specific elongation factor